MQPTPTPMRLRNEGGSRRGRPSGRPLVVSRSESLSSMLASSPPGSVRGPGTRTVSVTAPSELFSRLQAALGSQYRLERELGHGGMGVVFLARDTTLDRPVAVKVVHPDLAIHSSITQRFLAEARMIARLRHPSIVAVHTAGETTGVFYYVMDYVPGESLRQRLTREGKFPVQDVARIVADLADALHTAGLAGLVHRDVKPENILLDEASGRAMLADFGIARAMAADPDGTRTGQGVAVGTPTYMSPEQAAGDQVDARSDLYALGVVAFELLTGRPPFRGQTRRGGGHDAPGRSADSGRVAAPRDAAGPRGRHHAGAGEGSGGAMANRSGVTACPAGRWRPAADAAPTEMAPRRAARGRDRGRRPGAGAGLRAGRSAERGQSAPLDPGPPVRQPAPGPHRGLAAGWQRQHAGAEPVAVE